MTVKEVDVPAIPPHDTAIVDVPWDGPASEAKIPNDAGESELRKMYAWVDPGKDPNTKTAYKLSHHEVENGKPGAANVNGVRNALSRIPQMRPRLSATDEAGVRRHLQRHLDAFNARSAEMDETPREGMRALFGHELEVRTAEDGRPVLAGYLAVFNEWTEIDSAVEGHFMERIAPGAFTKTFREKMGQIRCIFHHGLDPAVGFRPLGPPAVLEERSEGAWSETPLLDTHYVNELVPGIREGLYGMSFRFRAVRSNLVRFPKKSAHNPKGLSERTLTELAIPEFGPTPFPAYAGATAGLRSVTDDALLARLTGDPDRLEELLRHRNGGSTFSVSLSGVTADHGEPQEDVDGPEAPGSAESHRAVTERLYQRAVSFASATPWAMEPSALQTVTQILAERRAGIRHTAEEISVLIGTRAEPDTAPEGSNVKVIQVSGPIVPKAGMIDRTSSELTSVEKMSKQFQSALSDENVAAIVFNIDSPGGSAAMVPEFAQEIMDARGTKPVVAMVNTMAASAAYWLACACDEIVMSPSADAGSIGVWSAHSDHSGELERLGQNITIIQSEDSPYKTELNPFGPLSDSAQAEMQRRVDSIMDDFVAAVAAGRGTTTEDVLKNFGQGRVVMAKDAVAAGMADSIATFDRTLARLEGTAASAPAPTEEAHSVEAAKPDGAESAFHTSDARRGQIDPVTLQRKEAPSWELS